jgi:hypothetical protein
MITPASIAEKIGAMHMIILEKPILNGRWFSTQTLLALIVALGFAALAACLLASLWLIGSLLSLVILAWSELITHITQLYSTSDSLTRLLFLIIVGYLAFKLLRSAYRSLQSRS